MLLSIIVAASENNVIGIQNQLPWSLPQDLRYFKRVTMGHPVIMGRKTFESVGRPLPGRPNIVITRQQDYEREGITVVNSLEAAIDKARELDKEEAFITGGSEIFIQAMPLVRRIYLTRVHAQITGDAFFPEIDGRQWKRVSAEPHAADDKHAHSYTFEVWDRV